MSGFCQSSVSHLLRSQTSSIPRYFVRAIQSRSWSSSPIIRQAEMAEIDREYVDRTSPVSAYRKPLPTILAARARITPERTFALVPKTKELKDGYREITYAQVQRGVDRLSWWLDEKLGKLSPPVKTEEEEADGERCGSRDFTVAGKALESYCAKFPTIAYMGGTDLRYGFLVIAAAKTFRQLLLPLYTNSKEAQIKLVTKTNCKTLLASKEFIPRWNSVLEERDDLAVLEIPEFDDLIAEGEVKPYPFTKTWEEVRDDPVHIIHTSGTTGLPKPVVMTHFMCGLFNIELLNMTAPDRTALHMMRFRRVITPMPPCWLLGLVQIMHFPLGLDSIPILLPADMPMPIPPEYMHEVHKVTNAEGGVYAPDLLKQLCKVPEYLEKLKLLKFVMFGGAPLDKTVGDLLSSSLTVQSAMGSTEMGSYSLLESDPEYWNYYRFQPTSGSTFVPFEDDLYELVIVRNKDPDMLQSVFVVFPDLEEYHTKDLWRPHPIKAGLWLYSGRTDDFTKMTSMTKFNATDVESKIERDPLVKFVAMGGDNKEEPFMIIQVADGFKEGKTDAEMLEKLWPAVEKANEGVNEEVRVKKRMILLADTERPIIRFAKGTLNRRETFKEYAKDIEALYMK